MKDKFFTETTLEVIPSYDLFHNEERVLFAFKTMEEIFDASFGEIDPPHKHNFYTILWSKDACGKHFIDFREYDIKPNIVFFVVPGQVHQVITPSRPIGSVIMFTREFLCKYNIQEEYITNLGLFANHSDAPPLEADQETTLRLSRYTEEIKYLLEKENHFRNDSIASWLKLFLIECNKSVINADGSNTQLVQTGSSIVRTFKQLLEKNLSQWHKVSDYAASINVTSDYLNSVLKNTIGQNAKEFIQNRLVLEAKRLGVHTDLTSKEISYNLGFEDPAHFSKFYKKVTGSNFSDFRESLKKYNTNG